MNKRDKIVRFLGKGVSASDIIKKGYAASQVYRLASSFKESHEPAKAFRAKKKSTAKKANAPAKPDKKAAAWRKRNPWFGVDENRTAAALLLHNQLVERGIEAGSDEYWDQIEIGTDPSPDLINNPKHYTHGGVETIDFIEAKGLGFCLGNVVKYVSRAGVKTHNPLEDLRKARWYLNREIEQLEKLEK